MRLLILPTLLLAGCVTGNTDPVVSAFNGSTVSVQAWGITPGQQPGDEDLALAKTTCPNAKYLSTRNVSEYKVEFLFQC